MADPALLVLADGTVFEGIRIGAETCSSGEVVFNTSVTGYQEIITDPSYARQLITLTVPHIGNTGVNTEDEECARIWASGLIVRDVPRRHSNWRAGTDLDSWMRERGIPGIAGIDTRQLTTILREKGAQNGALLTGPAAGTAAGRDQALAAARDFAGLEGMDLAREVTTHKSYDWKEGTWQLGVGHPIPPVAPEFRVVAYDFGIKRNILRMLTDRGCQVTVVPAMTPVEEVLAMHPDGVFLSNGPGDPEPCTYAVEAIRVLLERRIPLFGICLGHQLLGLAVGGRSLKMKFGHHGANHPVQRLSDRVVMITSQNHGFAVDAKSLPENVEVTHLSLFDGSLQGIRLKDRPAYSFQGHPEASPGPHEAGVLFAPFIADMRAHRAAEA